MARLPSPKDWESKDKQELLNTSVRGWNTLENLPRMLQKYCDWAKPLVFGFFTGEDVYEARANGWEHVQTGFFEGMDEYNKLVSTPFGLIDDGGVVKWKDNYLMMMSKDFREDEMAAKHAAYEKEMSQVLKNHSYAHPADPRYAEMKRASEELSTGETYRVQGTSSNEDVPEPPSIKRGPGRPPNKKED